jgi:magnesium transporter
MQFQVTTEFLDKLREAIKSNNEKFVSDQLHELFPPDIAEILNELSVDEAKYLYKHLDEQQAADVLVELEEDVRERFLASLSSKEIAEKFIDNLESDEAADVIQELPEEKQDEVLSHMEDSEQASDVEELLKYDEKTAGGIMMKELVSVHLDKNMFECVRQMRQYAEHIEDVYTIYVVDDQEKLVGLVPLKKLLTVSLREKISKVMKKEFISVRANLDVEEVAKIMEKYDLVFVPVVDALGRLVGRITFDDVMDVIREEETEDVQKMAGMEALDEPYMNVSLWGMLKKRAGWLVILFIGESFTATAMSFFEDRIQKAVVLALFVPLIISSGGNTGSQASSLIIRAIALGEVTVREWWRIFSKEIRVGFALGCLLGLIGFLRVAIWQAFAHFYGPHWMMIGLAVGVSLVGVVLWGNLIGSLFPLFLKRVGLDPAVSSAPFVATFVDVTGLVIYFTVASLLLSELMT